MSTKNPRYKSDFERAAAKKLKSLRRHHFKYELERLPYIIEAVYIPDWTSIRNGTIIEAKGVLDATERRKMRAVKAAHPDRRIVMLLMEPHRKAPGLKMTRAKWCERNGFEWCSLQNVGEYV